MFEGSFRESLTVCFLEIPSNPSQEQRGFWAGEAPEVHQSWRFFRSARDFTLGKTSRG